MRLNLKDADAVSAAAHDLSPLGTGLYVERMVRDGIAELFVRFTRDPMFGPVMTLGSGGVLVELMRDSVTLMLPVTHDDIEAALRGLNFCPLLEGYRGKPRADLKSGIDVIAGIADFVQKNAREIEDLDVNPLIICEQGKGAWIADALLMVEENKRADVVTICPRRRRPVRHALRSGLIYTCHDSSCTMGISRCQADVGAAVRSLELHS